MSNFKIDFGSEWNTLRKNLSESSYLAKAVPDVSIAILKFHNSLENRIEELYNTPYGLSRVMLGSSVKPGALGKTFLRYGLQYRDKAIPLGEYKHTVEDSSSLSSAPLRLNNEPLGFVVWNRYRWSKKIRMEIRKRKVTGARRGGNFSKLSGFKMNAEPNKIFARETNATWSTYPTKGVKGTRAPYSELYGPSLAILASSVFDKDKKIDKAKDTLADDILDAITRNF